MIDSKSIILHIETSIFSMTFHLHLMETQGRGQAFTDSYLLTMSVSYNLSVSVALVVDDEMRKRLAGLVAVTETTFMIL